MNSELNRKDCTEQNQATQRGDETLQLPTLFDFHQDSTEEAEAPKDFSLFMKASNTSKAQDSVLQVDESNLAHQMQNDTEFKFLLGNAISGEGEETPRNIGSCEDSSETERLSTVSVTSTSQEDEFGMNEDLPTLRTHQASIIHTGRDTDDDLEGSQAALVDVLSGLLDAEEASEKDFQILETRTFDNHDHQNPAQLQLVQAQSDTRHNQFYPLVTDLERVQRTSKSSTRQNNLIQPQPKQVVHPLFGGFSSVPAHSLLPLTAGRTNSDHEAAQLSQSLHEQLQLNLNKLNSNSLRSDYSTSNIDLSGRFQTQNQLSADQQQKNHHRPQLPVFPSQGLNPHLNRAISPHMKLVTQVADSSNRTGRGSVLQHSPLIPDMNMRANIKSVFGQTVKQVANGHSPQQVPLSSDPYYYLQMRQQNHKSSRSAYPSHQHHLINQNQHQGNARTLRAVGGHTGAKVGNPESNSSYSNSSRTTVPVRSLNEVRNPSLLITFRFANRQLTHLNDINKFRNLTELDVSGNLLTSEVQELNCLPFLKKLNLAGNKIREMWQLPQTLEVLNISQNQLKALNSEVTETLCNLTTLDISSNGLDSLLGVQHLTRLKRLIAKSNQIQKIGLLSELQTLVEIDLENNPVDSYAEVMKAVHNKKDVLVLNLLLSPLMVKIASFEDFCEHLNDARKEHVDEVDERQIDKFKKILSFLKNGVLYRSKRVYAKILQHSQMTKRSLSNNFSNGSSSNRKGGSFVSQPCASNDYASQPNNTLSYSGTNNRRRKAPFYEHTQHQKTQCYEALDQLYDKILEEEDRLLWQQERKLKKLKRAEKQQRREQRAQESKDSKQESSSVDSDDTDGACSEFSNEFDSSMSSTDLPLCVLEALEDPIDLENLVEIDESGKKHDPENFLNASTADFNKEIRQINQELLADGHGYLFDHYSENKQNDYQISNKNTSTKKKLKLSVHKQDHQIAESGNIESAAKRKLNLGASGHWTLQKKGKWEDSEDPTSEQHPRKLGVQNEGLQDSQVFASRNKISLKLDLSKLDPVEQKQFELTEQFDKLLGSDKVVPDTAQIEEAELPCQQPDGQKKNPLSSKRVKQLQDKPTKGIVIPRLALQNINRQLSEMSEGSYHNNANQKQVTVVNKETGVVISTIMPKAKKMFPQTPLSAKLERELAKTLKEFELCRDFVANLKQLFCITVEQAFDKDLCVLKEKVVDLQKESERQQMVIEDFHSHCLRAQKVTGTLENRKKKLSVGGMPLTKIPTEHLASAFANTQSSQNTSYRQVQNISGRLCLQQFLSQLAESSRQNIETCREKRLSQIKKSDQTNFQSQTQRTKTSFTIKQPFENLAAAEEINPVLSQSKLEKSKHKIMLAFQKGAESQEEILRERKGKRPQSVAPHHSRKNQETQEKLGNILIEVNQLPDDESQSSTSNDHKPPKSQRLAKYQSTNFQTQQNSQVRNQGQFLYSGQAKKNGILRNLSLEESEIQQLTPGTMLADIKSGRGKDSNINILDDYYQFANSGRGGGSAQRTHIGSLLDDLKHQTSVTKGNHIIKNLQNPKLINTASQLVELPITSQSVLGHRTQLSQQQRANANQSLLVSSHRQQNTNPSHFQGKSSGTQKVGVYLEQMKERNSSLQEQRLSSSMKETKDPESKKKLSKSIQKKRDKQYGGVVSMAAAAQSAQNKNRLPQSVMGNYQSVQVTSAERKSTMTSTNRSIKNTAHLVTSPKKLSDIQCAQKQIMNYQEFLNSSSNEKQQFQKQWQKSQHKKHESVRVSATAQINFYQNPVSKKKQIKPTNTVDKLQLQLQLQQLQSSMSQNSGFALNSGKRNKTIKTDREQYNKTQGATTPSQLKGQISQRNPLSSTNKAAVLIAPQSSQTSAHPKVLTSERAKSRGKTKIGQVPITSGLLE